MGNLCVVLTLEFCWQHLLVCGMCFDVTRGVVSVCALHDSDARDRFGIIWNAMSRVVVSS